MNASEALLLSMENNNTFNEIKKSIKLSASNGNTTTMYYLNNGNNGYYDNNIQETANSYVKALVALGYRATSNGQSIEIKWG